MRRILSPAARRSRFAPGGLPLWLLGIGAALGGPSLAPAQQQSVTLVVTVATTAGERLGGALVTIADARTGPMGRVTDAGGRLELRGLRAGEYAIRVRHLGYRSEAVDIHLEPGAAVTAEFTLEPEPIPLAEVRVDGEAERRRAQLSLLRGFHERRERGVGYFLTREEIEEHGSTDLSNLLRTVPGLRAPPSQFGQSRIHSGRSQPGRRCQIRAYLDGMKYRDASDLPGIPTSDIEAIEVYRGRSELPADFADLDADCGVIVIWSRRHDAARPHQDP